MALSSVSITVSSLFLLFFKPTRPISTFTSKSILNPSSYLAVLPALSTTRTCCCAKKDKSRSAETSPRGSSVESRSTTLGPGGKATVLLNRWIGRIIAPFEASNVVYSPLATQKVSSEEVQSISDGDASNSIRSTSKVRQGCGCGSENCTCVSDCVCGDTQNQI
jgi:hypothetical protein